MTIKGHELDFRPAENGKTELYVDGQLEGVFEDRDAAIEYVESEIDEA